MFFRVLAVNNSSVAGCVYLQAAHDEKMSLLQIPAGRKLKRRGQLEKKPQGHWHCLQVSAKGGGTPGGQNPGGPGHDNTNINFVEQFAPSLGFWFNRFARFENQCPQNLPDLFMQKPKCEDFTHLNPWLHLLIELDKIQS